MTAEVIHAVGLVFAGLFAGVAMAESIVEHPVRLAAPAANGIDAVRNKACDPYMPILALGGSAGGVIAYLLDGAVANLIRGLLLVAMVPFAITLIQPINKRSIAHRPTDGNAAQIVALMRRWSRLDTCRSISGTLALIAMAFSPLL